MHKNKTLIGFAAAAAMLPGAAMAAEGLSYNYVQAFYAEADLDDTDVDADGYSLSGSALVSENVYVAGSYSSLETDNFTILGFTGSIEANTMTAGLGFRQALQPNTTDVYFEANFLRGEIEYGGDFSFIDEDDDNGYGLSLGLRHLFSPLFEVGASINYVDIFDDDSTSFDVGALFHLTEVLSVGAAYSLGDDSDTIGAGVRLNF